MKMSVVIPTYRRPQDLQRCLEAIGEQTRSPDEVLVVVRDSDRQTWQFLETHSFPNLPLRTVTVSVTGVVAAMNAGLEAMTGDTVSFTDDDAAPHKDWLARIEAYFQADRAIGGIGGKDWVYHGSELEAGSRETVGKLQWFGRAIGNHHIGVGRVREVDILKGVNMSFRRTAIEAMRFDTRMRGTGAQVHFELAFSLKLKEAGWKLIYDPQIAVDHHRGERYDEDQRDRLNELALANAVHNETLVLLEHLSPLQKIVFLIWAVLVGTRKSMGLLQWLRFLPSQGLLANKRWWATMRGRWLGLTGWLNSGLRSEKAV